MPKRALPATPSLAVSISFRKFAASVVKDEERKKKRLRKSSAAVRNEEKEVKVRSGDSGAEGSSPRIVKTKDLPGSDGDVSERLKSTCGEHSSSSLNRKESTGDGDAEVPQEDWSFPTDTLVALKIMWQQFPKIDRTSVPPFVLRSQIYSSVIDKTVADRELEQLKEQRVVRIFKLNSGKDDFGIMLMGDYLKQIEDEKRLMRMKRSEEETCVFDWFTTHVVKAHTGVSIGHQHLIFLLSHAGNVEEKQVSLLINSGLLVRQTADETTYWFGIPNVGTLLKSLSAGRNELISSLRRRTYREMLQAELERRRLRFSLFDIRFHIRDLIGSGHLYITQTPVGPLIRVRD